jgi:hypothetical protein
MVSAPPRELLPALLLVIVGLFFCTVAVTGVTNQSAPHTYSVAQAGDSCANSSTATYEFDELSPRGQAFFLETLESESSETIIERESPPEFSVVPGHQGREAAEVGNGVQYISKDGNCYELTIQGSGGSISFRALYQLIVGTGFVLAGSLSYVRSYTLLPSVFVGGSAVFVIPRLLWLAGLFRWSMWMEGLPQFQIAAVIMGLIYFSVILYIVYPNQ